MSEGILNKMSEQDLEKLWGFVEQGHEDGYKEGFMYGRLVGVDKVIEALININRLPDSPFNTEELNKVIHVLKEVRINVCEANA